jgi:lipopolysaccharide export system permease protein
MLNGNRQEVSRETGELSLLHFDRYSFDIPTANDTTGKRWREPGERFLDELFYPDMTDENNKFNVANLRAEGHERLTMPIYALTFTIIALSALLSGDFDRRGLGRRMAVAILLIIIIQAGAMGFTNLATRFPPLVPLVYLNALLPLVGGLYVLFGRGKRISGHIFSRSPAALKR